MRSPEHVRGSTLVELSGDGSCLRKQPLRVQSPVAPDPPLEKVRQAAEIISAAHEYAVIRAVGLPAAFCFAGLAVWLHGQGRVRAPRALSIAWPS